MTSSFFVRRVLPWLIVVQGIAHAQPMGAAIDLKGNGPYYRLTLPLAIHGLDARSDLRDVRVVNAAGHAVPRAWLRDEAVAPRVTAQDVPIFALPRSDGGAEADAAVVVVRPDGSLGLGVKARRPTSQETAQWLIDVSRVEGSLLQARFALAPEARGLFAFRLEASDDLRQWRRVGDDEQLVRLTQGGQTVERLAVDLGRVRARFLRLTWLDAQQGAPLTGVGIDSIQDVESVAPVEWLPSLQPERCAVDHCDYLLPRGVPVQNLRIDLADRNTLAEVSISGVQDEVPGAVEAQRPVPVNPLYSLRHRKSRPHAAVSNEVLLLDTVAYRLAQGTAEARSPVLALDGRSYPRLRLRTSGSISALGATPPSIAIGATPRTLVFLAQGEGPFVLRWDAASPAAVASMALSTLIPGYTAARLLVADQASVALPMPLADATRAAGAAVTPVQAGVSVSGAEPARKWWLWSALGIGLLLLAGMAWSLFASLRKGRTTAG